MTMWKLKQILPTPTPGPTPGRLKFRLRLQTGLNFRLRLRLHPKRLRLHDSDSTALPTTSQPWSCCATIVLTHNWVFSLEWLDTFFFILQGFCTLTCSWVSFNPLTHWSLPAWAIICKWVNFSMVWAFWEFFILGMVLRMSAYLYSNLMEWCISLFS